MSRDRVAAVSKMINFKRQPQHQQNTPMFIMFIECFWLYHFVHVPAYKSAWMNTINIRLLKSTIINILFYFSLLNQLKPFPLHDNIANTCTNG